jgi:hypothetical protein
MKQMIGKVGDVVTYVEVNPVQSLPTWQHVKITSVWENARDPSPHTKFDMCMDREMFDRFKQTINQL